MNKHQAQLDKVMEELLSDNLDDLLKELLDAAVSSAKDASGRINQERLKLAALGREALESMDHDHVERWARQAIRSLDADKLEKWVRKSLRAIDTEKLMILLRDSVSGLDKEKLEGMLKESMRYFDRRKLEEIVHKSIHSFDLEKLRAAVRSGLTELDPGRIESFVNERVDNVVRARLNALSSAELELLLENKRATEKAAEKLAEKLAEKEGEKETEKAEVIQTNLERKGKGKAKAAKKNTKDVVADKTPNDPITALIGTLGRIAVVGAAGWIAYSHFLLEHQVPLPKAMAAELLTLLYRPAGPINVYQDRTGTGRPVVLIHSINAAASSYEMRPLFQHFRGQRPVFAVDLPGFGFSARSAIEYSPEIYVNAILTVLAGIDGEAADVVALSLGGEFAAEAARRRPDLFNSLTLISPTGMQGRESASSSQVIAVSGLDAFIYPLLAFRLWARPFFDLLTIRRTITYFLQRSFVGPIPEGMVDYAFATSHQPGAEHAPLYFVAGKLFTPNAVDRIYRQLTTPIQVIYDQDGFVTFERLDEVLAANKAIQATRIGPTQGLPHWEKLEATTQALEKFWQSVNVTA